MYSRIKIIISIFCLLACAVSVQAKLKYGVKAGYNISKMELNTSVFDTSHRNGFFFGPVLKLGLPGGFDIDGAALFNRVESNIADFEGSQEGVGRSSLAFQVDFRKAFGFGDTSDVFVFVGPQWDINVSQRSNDVFQGGNLRWNESLFSLNMGVGAMLFGTIEAKIAYNIPFDSASDITFLYKKEQIRVSPKYNTWELGLAVYF